MTDTTPSRPVGRLRVEGVGLWSPSMPGWAASRALLRGEAGPPDAPARLPPTDLLPPAERRRAPATVTLALAVAQAACREAGRDPRALPSVFVSAHGDVEITDYLCSVLASTPEHLSPTRFHHSVHNAPAGYWTIATGCMAPSTAMAAGDHGVAAGLLEAASLALAEGRPALLVVYDLPAVGALASVTASDLLFGAAWVLAPDDADAAPGGSSGGSSGLATLSLALDTADAAAPPPAAKPAAAPAWQADVGRTPAAGALPLLAALAADGPTRLVWPIGDSDQRRGAARLRIDVVPAAAGRHEPRI